MSHRSGVPAASNFTRTVPAAAGARPALPPPAQGRHYVPPPWLVLLCLLAGLARASGAAGAPPKVGETIRWGSWTAEVLIFDTLPYVDDEYTQRHRFDLADNPTLEELRRRYRLDDVVRGGHDEFERQIRIMDWTHRQFPKFGRPSTNCHGALRILENVAAGHTFYCAHYAEVLISAAASLGWVNRPLALRRHQGVNRVGGSTEHTVTEIWSNQHRKWVMLDPTGNFYVERQGVPLNAWEIRQEWFYQGGTNLVFVVGQSRQRHRKSDLPIVLASFADFGELAVHPDELDKYGFIGYIPNNDLMTSGYDYAKMFITKDALCDGTSWHLRPRPTNPAVDPYFPVGQAALELGSDDKDLRVTVRTLTPNLDRIEARSDRSAWRPIATPYPWPIHVGVNRLEVRTINRFGVAGPISTLELGAVNRAGSP